MSAFSKHEDPFSFTELYCIERCVLCQRTEQNEKCKCSIDKSGPRHSNVLLHFCIYFSQAQSLNDKVQQLLDMNMKRSVLKFNGNKFKDFVKTAPRNYSMIIMFTAMVKLIHSTFRCRVVKNVIFFH